MLLEIMHLAFAKVKAFFLVAACLINFNYLFYIIFYLLVGKGHYHDYPNAESSCLCHESVIQYFGCG